MKDELLNPCKCGSKKSPNIDSDDMVPCWGVSCYSCKQFQHGESWTYNGAVRKWNDENPIIAVVRDKKLTKLGI